jgi:hypothetical protein
MITDFLASIITRDLRALRREIEAYENEEDIWMVPPGIGNAAGTLALHCVGNLRHFIGTELGGTGFVRDRPAEFSARNVSREVIVAGIEAAITDVTEGLAGFEDDRLSAAYPRPIGDTHARVGDFLIHLATHLAFHLGQVDYHRRLVTGDSYSVSPVAIPELSSATAEGDAAP